MPFSEDKDEDEDYSEDTQSFGELLKWFRESKNLTQQDIAKKLEVSRPRISEWESGQFAPRSRDRIAKLAHILQLSEVEKNQLLQAANFHVTIPLPTFEPHNPYKGLAAFTQDDHLRFFGRETLIQDLLSDLQRIIVTPTAPRILAVLGPSGSGKTSVVQAGLLPELQQGALPGSESWHYIKPLRPGQNPLESVAETFASVLQKDSIAIYQHLKDDPLGLCHLASSVAQTNNEVVVLVVDQFEEVFSSDIQSDDMQSDIQKQDLQRFIDLLVRACREPECPLLLLIVCRVDYYSHLATYRDFAQFIVSSQRLIFPLDQEPETLRRIIEEPAKLSTAKLTFEKNLVDEILYDLHGQVGVLPLLQFTLDLLFQHRDSHLLTRHAYHELGRVKGALAQYIENIYKNLPSQEHHKFARFLFLRLFHASTSNEEHRPLTRRQAPLEEFTLCNQQDTQMLREVIAIFIGKRLLVTNRTGTISTLEVSHEALLQAWPRLTDWIKEAGDTIRLQQTISEDAASWKRHGQSVDRLYRGSELVVALRWRETNLPNLDEDSFLQASLREQQRLTRRNFLLGSGAAALIGTLGVGWLVTLLHSSPPNPPLKGFFPGFSQKDLGGPIVSVAWSPDGKHIAFSSSDNTNTIQVVDASNDSRSYRGHIGTVSEIAWSPDGKRIASASDDNTVRVWDVANANLLYTYTKHTGAVESVAWSPDGKRIASGSKDNTVRVWDATNANSLLTYAKHADRVKSVAWSPDGKRIASGSWDKTVQIWDATNANPLLTYAKHTDAVWGIAWSPDGKYIASASADNTVQVWDTRNANPLLTYAKHTDVVESVTWSMDRKRIASGSADNTMQVWDARNAYPLLTYKGQTADREVNTITSVAWSPDDTLIAFGSTDKTLQVWDARSTNSSLLTYTKHTGTVWGVAWSPDSKYIASASDDETVQIWDATNANPLLTCKGNEYSVTSVAWSPDGRRIASASLDGTMQIWDAANANPLLTCKGNEYSVTSVAWSPDGRRIASGSEDYTVRIWDATNANPLLTYTKHADAVWGIAWSPDGTRIASASWDKTVQVWSATNARYLFTCKGHTGSIRSVAWSPNGKRIASASDDNTVRIWDASNGKLLFLYNGHAGNVMSVAWSPDGTHIVSAFSENIVQIWDTRNGKTLLTYSGHAGNVTSVAWSPDGTRIASASWDQTVQCYDGWAW